MNNNNMDVIANEISEKINDLQKYVPYLIGLIDSLREDHTKEEKLNQMQLLYNLLTNPDKRITLAMLTKCEEVLERCFGQGKNSLKVLNESKVVTTEKETELENVDDQLNDNEEENTVDESVSTKNEINENLQNLEEENSSYHQIASNDDESEESVETYKDTSIEHEKPSNELSETGEEKEECDSKIECHTSISDNELKTDETETNDEEKDCTANVEKTKESVDQVMDLDSTSTSIFEVKEQDSTQSINQESTDPDTIGVDVSMEEISEPQSNTNLESNKEYESVSNHEGNDDEKETRTINSKDNEIEQNLKIEMNCDKLSKDDITSEDTEIKKKPEQIISKCIFGSVSNEKTNKFSVFTELERSVSLENQKNSKEKEPEELENKISKSNSSLENQESSFEKEPEELENERSESNASLEDQENGKEKEPEQLENKDKSLETVEDSKEEKSTVVEDSKNDDANKEIEKKDEIIKNDQETSDEGSKSETLLDLEKGEPEVSLENQESKEKESDKLREDKEDCGTTEDSKKEKSTSNENSINDDKTKEVEREHEEDDDEDVCIINEPKNETIVLDDDDDEEEEQKQEENNQIEDNLEKYEKDLNNSRSSENHENPNIQIDLPPLVFDERKDGESTVKSTEIDDSLDRSKDPLSLDKDLDNLNEAIEKHFIPQNPLTELVLTESDIERLLHEQNLKNNLDKEKISITNTTGKSDKTNQLQSPSEKSKVMYLVKKDPKRSLETIELLDSDDEYNNNNDDVIVVSAQSPIQNPEKRPTQLQKVVTNIENSKSQNLNNIVMSAQSPMQNPEKRPVQSQKLVTNIENRKSQNLNEGKNQNASLNKSKTIKSSPASNFTSLTPMFSISSVESIGVPTTKNSGKNIKTVLPSPSSSSSLLTLSSLNRIPTIIGSTTIKRNYPTLGNEYQATLRVCTPVKEPETSHRDFLSAFQNFSATKGYCDVRPKFKLGKRNKPTQKQILNDDSTTTISDSISYSSNQSITQKNNSIRNKCKDEQVNKEWLENFITNILSPTQFKTKYALEILNKSLDPERYHQLKTIIDSHNNPEDKCRTLVVSEKILAILPDGSTTEKIQLIVKTTNEVNIDKLNEEIRELFVKNGVITEIGHKLCALSGNYPSKVLTRDRRNGQVTSCDRRSICDQRKIDSGDIKDDNNDDNVNDNNVNNNHDNDNYVNDDDDDDEYSPSVTIDVDEEITQERKRSLRCKSRKQINWKPFFTDDDEEDYDLIIEPQMKKSKNENDKKKSTRKIKRENGESGAELMPEHERKKIKIEGNALIQTPFDTDLLTPTWFESEDLVDNNSQENSYSNFHEDDSQSYPSSLNYFNAGGDDTSRTMLDDNYDTNKNINPAHHCRSQFVDACLLCGEKVQHAVSHYVNQHPNNEVMISRITQGDVDFILNHVNYALIANQKEKTESRTCQYTAFCVFCKRDMKFALRYWWEHFTMHTGEYGYECTGCKTKRPRKQSTRSHINNQCKKGRKSKIHELYEFDTSLSEIRAYICTLCNYIKLHRINIESHLKGQHSINSSNVPSHIIEIKLIQFAGVASAPPSTSKSVSGGTVSSCNKSVNNIINSNKSKNKNKNNNKKVKQNHRQRTAAGDDNDDDDNDGAKYNEYREYNNASTIDATAAAQDAEFMEYSSIMQSHDDLSFMICNMLASDVPESNHNVNSNNLNNTIR